MHFLLKFNSNFAEKMRDNFTGNGNRCTWLCFLLSWKIEGKRYFRNRIKIKIKAGYFRSIAEDNLSSSRTPTEHRCNISPWNATSILHILFVCLLICIAFFHWFIWFNFSFFSRFCAVFVLFGIIHSAFAWNNSNLGRVIDAESSGNGQCVLWNALAPTSLAILSAHSTIQ